MEDQEEEISARLDNYGGTSIAELLNKSNDSNDSILNDEFLTMSSNEDSVFSSNDDSFSSSSLDTKVDSS